MSNNLEVNLKNILTNSHERESKNEVRFPDLIKFAEGAIADSLTQSENEKIEATRRVDALDFLEPKLIERYKSVDIKSFIKDLDSVGETIVAEGIAKIYGIDINTLRTRKYTVLKK